MHERYLPVRLGDVTPTGWLRRQLELQAAGLTGQVEDVWPDVGPASSWRGGDGEDWERGPYYLDGLVPLAHVLDDDKLRSRAEPWLEWILASQDESGQFGPTTNDDWWPRMVALKVLVQHAEATGDERVVPFLARYFAFQLAELPGRPLREWGAYRATENVLAALWLYRRDRDRRWLELSRLLLAQNADWVRYLRDDLVTGRATVFHHLTHCVNVAMGLKVPAVRAALDGELDRHRADLRACLDELDRWHGQVHGVFSGDEWLAGREASQGIETCQVVEYMYTLEQSALVFGDAALGDLLENVAFNLLPAACDARMLAHQYHQQANQIAATVAERRWTMSSADANIFGLEPHFGCCLANLHQGWPKLVASLWMRAADDDAIAVLCYGPSTLRTHIAGTDVQLAQETDYPFEETARFTLTTSAPVEFELRLRVPGWCEAMDVAVAGRPVAATPGPDGFLQLRRTWATGDTVDVRLPMTPRRVRRERNAVGVRLGPLVLAATVAESWRALPQARGLGEWEVVPLSSWNYGLDLGARGGPQGWPVERRPVPEAPFNGAAPPVVVRGRGARVYAWQEQDNSAAPPPDGPVAVSSPAMEVALVPYGSARLRLAELPTVLRIEHPDR